LNIQTEHLDNHTARLTVEVDPERVESALRTAARRIAKKSRIPGFRPGKAPLNVVMNMFGRDYILSEALEDLGSEIYREALEQADIEPYAPGNLEDFNQEDGLKLTFIVPKRPTVELGNYREIRVPFEVPEVTDKMVDDAMEGLREGKAVVEDVERPAQMGDLVTFSHIEIVVEGDEAEAEDAAEPDEDASAEAAQDEAEAATDDESEDEAGADEHAHHEHGDDARVLMHQHDYQRVLREDDQDLFPGFSQELVGLSAGDEKVFTLTLPDDFEDEELAGKTLRVEAFVDKVQSRLVADWSDALAESISDGQFKTILELRVDVRRRLTEMMEAQAENELVEKALDALVEGATIHYPPELVDEYIDLLLGELDQNMRRSGLTLDDYMKISGQTRETLAEHYRERAIWRAERALALGELVRQEQLSVSEDDLNAEIDRLSEQLGGEQAAQIRQFLASDASRSDISSRMVSDRALERLAAIAKGENPPIGAESAAPEAEAEAEQGEQEPAAAEAAPAPEAPETLASDDETPETEAIQPAAEDEVSE